MLSLSSRLHIHIFDTENRQFQVPESVLTRPASSSLNSDESDLEFHYNTSPFEFWISRKEKGTEGDPLFDTRKASLPAAPIPPLDADDSRTALDGFPLVFEDQYLQVRCPYLGFVPMLDPDGKLVGDKRTSGGCEYLWFRRGHR